MEPVRRAVITVSFDVLENVLALNAAQLKIVEVLPKHPLTFGARVCEIVVEGSLCPLVNEGAQYEKRTFVVRDEPNGLRETELL